MTCHRLALFGLIYVVSFQCVRCDWYDMVAVHGRYLESTPNGGALEYARLYGSIHEYAYYFVDILVGTPPQRQSVILDSGSSLLGFPCKGCQNCGVHIDKAFDVTKSETASWISCKDDKCFASCGVSNHCHYSQSYSEGSSISGNYFKDKVAIGDIERQNQFVEFDYVGCHDSETKLFTTQKANGIMGVSYPKGGRQISIIDALFGPSNVNTHVFAICLAEDGGLMTVGGYNSSIHMNSRSFNGPEITSVVEGKLNLGQFGNSPVNVSWTKIENHNSYKIEMVEMLSEDKVIAQGPAAFGSVIVDSGTTYSYFPPRIYESIMTSLRAACTSDSNCEIDADAPCWKITSPSNYTSIPSMFLKFKHGTVVEWLPRSYLYRRSPGYWCPGIDNNRMTATILGMSFMKNKNVVFDRENDLIGFADADCPNFSDESRPPPPQFSPQKKDSPSEQNQAGEPDQHRETTQTLPLVDSGSLLSLNGKPAVGAVEEQPPSQRGVNTVTVLWISSSLVITAIIVSMGVIIYTSVGGKTQPYQTMEDTYVEEEEGIQLTPSPDQEYPGEVVVTINPPPQTVA